MKLVKLRKNCNLQEYNFCIFCKESETIHSISQTNSTFVHVEDITLGAGEVA